MGIKIVSDSSSNVFTLEGAKYSTVPMKVNAGDKEFVDLPGRDVAEMVDYMRSYKGKSGSSCPNVQEWLDAYQGEDDIFAITISGALSGSYNSAQQAAELFMEQNPGRKAFVIDSLTAGPQQVMIIEKLWSLISQGMDFDTVKNQTLEFANHTHILFCLESMLNLARNGRVSPAAATIAGLLGIRGVGDVREGQITTVAKPRGLKKATQVLVEMIKERGFTDKSTLRIAHCFGENQAQTLVDAVKAEFPNATYILEPTTCLCSFYAEAGGLMIGFDGGFNTNNCHK